MGAQVAQFRFYAELNDFLPVDKRKKVFPYPFSGSPSVKDAIEALGVPHTEVDLILVNDQSVGFDYRLTDKDRVSIYPVFESLDISPVTRLREQPLRKTAFILDVHLGKLARLLRMLGFDTRYQRDYQDAEIIDIARQEHRMILTRDIGLLKHKSVTHGYWVRSTKPLEQAREVLHRFDLGRQVRPFTRCIRCNGVLEKTDKQAVLPELPARTAASRTEFYRCSSCGQVYWQGSHYDRMRHTIAHLLNEASSPEPDGDPLTR